MINSSRKHVFIAIRYSVIQMMGKSWVASRTSPELYVEKILSDKRLNMREIIFDKITYRSLVDLHFDEKKVKVTVIIMISDLLPKFRIDSINEIINSRCSNINYIVKSIRSDSTNVSREYDFNNIDAAIKETIKSQVNNLSNTVISTVRLDDDDGLSANFIEKLYSHMNEDLSGYALSFPYGFEGYYDDSNDIITELKHSYFPKNSVGLAYINSIDKNLNFKESKKVHIYNLGNHTKIDESTPCILDSSEAMYFKSINKTNDTGISIHHKYLPSVNGLNSLNRLAYVKEKLSNAASLPAIENIVELEVSKSCSALLALTKLLNERIQLREKQLKEAVTKNLN
jgi:hypothetical protein